MPVINCSNCSREYYIKPSQLARGGRFCSVLCRHESQRTGSWFKCHTCGKKVWKTRTDMSRSESGFFFCNKKCSMAWKNSELRSGPNHYLWNGGKATYRERLLRKSGKIKCNRCGVADVRVLDAHHKDSNRQNNVVENLEWLCKNCHFLAHHATTD